MKKVIPLSFLILVTLLVSIYVLKNPLSETPSIKVHAKHKLGPDKTGVYRVSLRATQSREGKEERPLAQIQGTLVQYEQSPGLLVSRWREISAFAMQDRVPSVEDLQAFTQQSVLSKKVDTSYQHYFARDYPQDWLRFQLNLMQRLTVALPSPAKESGAIYQRSESEEMGQYRVEYTNLDRGDYRDVKKKFISFDNAQIKLDRSDNTIHYVFTQDSRLISAEGQLAFTHDGAGGDRFVITLEAELIAVEPKTADASIALSDLELADESKVRLIATEHRRFDTIGFDEAMKNLPLITANTDGRDITLIFQALKYEIQARPERGIEIRDVILATTERDLASRRQLALAFGALAQSHQPPIANLLAQLADDCPDVFCKDQAIVGLNDHSQPTPESAKRMMELVTNPKDYDTAAAAVLAVGSIARKIGPQIPEATQTLIETFKKPEQANIRRSVIAAMGNHGDDAYLPFLNESAKDADPVVRGTAYYSYRNLQDGGVNETLTSAIEAEPDVFALNEGLKAAAYRTLPTTAYERIAGRIAKIENEHDARESTRLFMKSFENNPEAARSAMTLLSERSPIALIKSAVARRLEESKTF